MVPHHSATVPYRSIESLFKTFSSSSLSFIARRKGVRRKEEGNEIKGQSKSHSRKKKEYIWRFFYFGQGP